MKTDQERVVADALDPYVIAQKAEASILKKAVNAPHQVFLLAIMAGLFIGLGFVYSSVASVSGAGKIVGGLVFSLGLLFVIVLGTDLFTSSTMTLLTRANKQITWRQMFSYWGVVYSGNFIGAALLVFLILLSGHPFDNGGGIGLYYITTAEHKLSHSFFSAVGLGILCNLMVCLAVWMSYAGRTLTEKMVAVLFPVGLFISSGFEHSVANMFMVPAGIYTYHLASPEMLAQLGNPEHYGQVLNWGRFIYANLIPVSIGNIIGGGVMVGLYQWYVHLRPENKRMQAPLFDIHKAASLVRKKLDERAEASREEIDKY